MRYLDSKDATLIVAVTQQCVRATQLSQPTCWADRWRDFTAWKFSGGVTGASLTITTFSLSLFFFKVILK